MCLEFHPTYPALLAGGSFNGEIFLWDISKQSDPQRCVSKIDDYFHRECITQLQWVDSKNPKDPFVFGLAPNLD
jgi:WD40 repeat protein